MERGRYSGRGFIKNPPQPHMCIQDCLVGSDEPCFVNVLSWEKILMPAHPTDVIPLFGGMKIKNNSLNSLSCTNLYEGIKDGKQPLIFAVCTNTTILKQSGKNTKDPNERDAFVSVILDFIEAMNLEIKFQHKFKILPDRDVVGELKDIWFIIQSKRDQDRTELTLAEYEKTISGKLKDTTNDHWNYRDSDIERKQLAMKAYRSEQNSAKVLNTPHSSGSNNSREISYILGNLSQNSEKSKHVSYDRKSSIPFIYNDKSRSPAMNEAVCWSKQMYASHHVASSSSYTLPSSTHSLNNMTLKPLPPSFNETIQMKAREVKSAAMNWRNKTDSISQIYPIVHNKDKNIGNTKSTICKHSLASDNVNPSNEYVRCGEDPASTAQNTYESELAMCNQLWQGITTEFLPSFDARRSVSQVGFPLQDAATTTTEPNDPRNSETLVKRNLVITDMTNSAGLGEMSDEILDVQESKLVKELSSFDTLSVVENCVHSDGTTTVDATNVHLYDCSLPHVSLNISAENRRDKDNSMEYVPSTDVPNNPLKLNENIPSLLPHFKNQIHAQLSNEVNRNIDLSEYRAELHDITADVSQLMEHFATVDSNENVHA